MASINFATREINCKIVYYGPGLSGKTTNLQIVHQKLPKDKRSDMVSLATEQDRTLFFDFLPLDLGSIKGFKTKFQLYTVPGQVYYNSTRKLVLRGVDGVVFVADSQQNRMAENHESLQNLEENISEYGLDLKELPFVIQYNKRDLPDVLDIPTLQAELNPRNVPHTEATAHNGHGVIPTLKLAAKIVIEKFNAKGAGAFKRPAPLTRPGAAAGQAPVRPAAPTRPMAPSGATAPAKATPPSGAKPVAPKAAVPPPAPKPVAPPSFDDDEDDDDDMDLIPYSNSKPNTEETSNPAAQAPTPSPSFDDDDDEDDFDDDEIELRPYIPKK